MTALTLAQRVVAIDQALAAIPHAFGGALALAYYAEPRATIDIDLNVFVIAQRFPEVAKPLADLGAAVNDPQVESQILAEGQARVWWDTAPIDLFFAYDPFHDAAGRSRREVPFGDTAIPILAPEHLMVCKVVFNRGKDWVDIDAMMAAGTSVDSAEVLRWVARIAGDEDPRFNRIVAVLERQ